MWQPARLRRGLANIFSPVVLRWNGFHYPSPCIGGKSDWLGMTRRIRVVKLREESRVETRTDEWAGKAYICRYNALSPTLLDLQQDESGQDLRTFRSTLLNREGHLVAFLVTFFFHPLWPKMDVSTPQLPNRISPVSTVHQCAHDRRAGLISVHSYYHAFVFQVHRPLFDRNFTAVYSWKGRGEANFHNWDVFGTFSLSLAETRGEREDRLAPRLQCNERSFDT